MDNQKVQFIGNPCGHHGSYTFYKAFKFNQDNNSRILTLGEFFFVKIFSEAPVCISELQLLWEDKNNSQLLSSVRLYYLPEHTPEGKQEYHGQDEVLAVSEKIILKLEDLVSLIKDGVSWETGSIPFLDTSDTDNDKHPVNLAKSFAANNFGLKFKGHHEKENTGSGTTDSTQVTILSFPRYCRYRAVMKRLEKCEDQWLRNALVCAIGGFTVKNENSRVVFCRDTFDDPELENLEIRCDHLAPNLKGRPRKKRLLSKKESSQDSDSCESNGDLFIPPNASKGKSSPLSVRTRKDSHKNGALLTDKKDITKEEEAFLHSLHKYMRSRKTPIERIPSLGFKQIDIYVFYTYAQKLGGYDQITQKRLWKHLYDQLGGNPGSTSAATCTRRHYEKLLLPYERHKNGEEYVPLPTSPSGNSDCDKNENKEASTKFSKTDQGSQENHKQTSKKLKLSRPSHGPRSPDDMENRSQTPSGENARPVLTEQSVNRKLEGQNKIRVNSRSEHVLSNTEHTSDMHREDRVQDSRNRTKPSILNPVTSQKPMHHPSSPYHAPIIPHPYQKSPSLQSPPHYHPAHSAMLGYSPTQFVRAMPGTPPPGLANKYTPKDESYSKQIPGVKSCDSVRSVGQKAHVTSPRPSVIQHTHKIKPAHQHSPDTKAAPQGLDQRLSGPHPAHQLPPARQALPAHSNHLKRCYPPHLDPSGLGQPIHHVSPYHYTPQHSSQPLHSSIKRQRLQDPNTPQYYLAQMRTLAGDYAGKNRGLPSSDNRIAQPKPSHQPPQPRLNHVDEQPTDLSMKKKPESNVLNMSLSRSVTPNRDTPQHRYHSSPCGSQSRPLSRGIVSSASPSPLPASVKRLDRAASRSPLGVNRQVSPVPMRARSSLEISASGHASSPDLAMAAKTFPLPTDVSHLLHPAFPHSYLNPSIVPQGMINMSQQHVHSMYTYEARMRANVAKAVVYDEMVKRNMSHLQGSPSPSAYSSHSRTDSPRYHYPK